MIRRRRDNFGFTLIELIVVMVLIAIMLAVVAPSLSGFGSGRKLDNAVDQFLATTRWAQSQAVMDAQPLAIQIDSSANTYLVNTVNGDTRTPVAGEFGQAVTLPTGFKIELVSGGSGGNGGGNLILFQPDSRCTPAVVRFTSNLNETADVASNSPAEPFAKVVAK